MVWRLHAALTRNSTDRPVSPLTRSLAKQVLLGGPEWSPQRHAKTLPPFRAAARTLLLVNRCQGFPVGGSSGGGGSKAGTGLGGEQQQQQRVNLEPEILQSILQHAAADVGPWVAILERTVPWAERRRGGGWW